MSMIRTNAISISGRLQIKKAKVTSGIPQGSVLGPILFLIFINDLPFVIETLKKLFAVDAKIYQTVTSMAEVKQLQCAVNNSMDWSVLWEMFFNFKKCKHMHLGNHDMNQTYTMRKDQEELPIEKVESEKDLDVIIGNKLTFTKHNEFQNQNSKQEPWTYI